MPDLTKLTLIELYRDTKKYLPDEDLYSKELDQIEDELYRRDKIMDEIKDNIKELERVTK
jgi:hypothetical protein